MKQILLGRLDPGNRCTFAKIGPNPCVFFGPSAVSVREMLCQFFTLFRADAKRHECPINIFLQFSGVHKFRISSSSRFTSFNFVHLYFEGLWMDGWMDGWMDARMDGQISNCPHLHQAYLKEIGVYSSFWLTQYYIILILIPVPSLTFHYPRQDTRSRSVSSPHDRSPAQDVASAPYPCIPCSGLTAVRSSAVVIICCSGISQGCDDDHPSW